MARIKSGKSSGCGDNAAVFVALARMNNIPARMVECVDRDWLLGRCPKSISGHVFVDVCINECWRVVDPTIGNVSMSYNWPLGKEFIIYKKGIDSWDMNIKNYKDLEEKFGIFKKQISKSKR